MPPGPSATVRPSEEEPSESEATTTPEASDDNGEGEGESEGQSGEEREFTGVVEAIGSSQWTVDARTVEIDGDTEIHGEPHIGDQVKVQARRQSDGAWLAKEIQKAGEDD
jgi:hypothetical protein